MSLAVLRSICALCGVYATLPARLAGFTCYSTTQLVLVSVFRVSCATAVFWLLMQLPCTLEGVT